MLNENLTENSLLFYSWLLFCILCLIVTLVTAVTVVTDAGCGLVGERCHAEAVHPYISMP